MEEKKPLQWYLGSALLVLGLMGMAGNCCITYFLFEWYVLSIVLIALCAALVIAGVIMRVWGERLMKRN